MISNVNNLLPHGAIIKDNPSQMSYLCKVPCQWKIAVLNYTNLKISIRQNGDFYLNSLEVIRWKSPFENHQMIAYQVEDYTNLVFFKIMNSKFCADYYVDVNNKEDKLFDSSLSTHVNVFKAEPAEGKIKEISDYMRQKKQINLILNSHSDKDSFFSTHGIPEDILTNIVQQYAKILK